MGPICKAFLELGLILRAAVWEGRGHRAGLLGTVPGLQQLLGGRELAGVSSQEGASSSLLHPPEGFGTERTGEAPWSAQHRPILLSMAVGTRRKQVGLVWEGTTPARPS